MCEIVLDERRWVENALRNCDIGRNPYTTITRLSKYFYADGFSREEIRKRIGEFIMRCDTGASVVKWRDTIDSALKNAEKHPLVNIPGISVTKSELEKIASVNGVIRQRLMFTLLCVAKFEDAVRGKDDHWVNYSRKDIFSLANIKVGAKLQALYMNDLFNDGLIGFSSIVDNVNVRVLIVDDGECDMFVTDFRNLGNQYMQRMHGGYIVCESCGAVVKRMGNKQKYCRDCSADINREKTLSAYYERMTRNL